MTRRPRRNRSGLSIVIAVVMLGLVSVALLLFTRELGYELKRTTLSTDDAQLRQLLLAGANDTAVRAKSWGPETTVEHWAINMPQTLADQHASVEVQFSRWGVGAQATITASFHGREQIQKLLLHRQDDRWQVVSATLGN